MPLWDQSSLSIALWCSNGCLRWRFVAWYQNLFSCLKKLFLLPSYCMPVQNDEQGKWKSSLHVFIHTQIITIIRYRDIKKIPFYGAHGVNSGVMLMRLDMMRSLNWEAEMVQLVRQFGRKTSYGDQDLINIYFNRHPDRLLVYPCIWNYRSDHCFFGQVNDTGGK